MPGSGNCACGNIAFEYAGDPVLNALCHCRECQRISGSAFSANVVVPTAAFSLLKGAPKSWSRTGLSEKEVLQFFCGECGSSLFSRPSVMEGITMIKAGSLHDADINIKAELFVKRRQNYMCAVDGAKQASESLS